MPDSPLSIGFNVPFHEAIAQAVSRKVVLPQDYYGKLQGIARQKAFSIAGITALDQLQAVKDSLDSYIAKGGSINQWRKEQAVIDLGLPKHRLDNIYRTNLQASYMAGKWEQFNNPMSGMRYLMYDAINDSRVRPAHLALDGIIRAKSDPFWGSHSPPCGLRCRCSLIQLSDKQATARSVNGKGLNQQPVMKLKDGSIVPANPDNGWSYDKTNRMAGIEKAIAEKPESLLKSTLEKRLVEEIPSMSIPKEAQIAENLLFKLIANVENAQPESQLKELWSNKKRYDEHIDKRIRFGEITSEMDYQNKTFDVLANASKIIIAIPKDSGMISGKVQLVVDGWVVVLGENGEIVTSYPFDKSKQTFEQNEINAGSEIYEHSMIEKTSEILKRVFGLS